MEIQTRKLVWMCCLEEAPLVVTQAVEGANVTDRTETRTQSLEELRRLCISVSISRTRCAASNDITRQEIRTFEVHQTISSSVTCVLFCKFLCVTRTRYINLKQVLRHILSPHQEWSPYWCTRVLSMVTFKYYFEDLVAVTKNGDPSISCIRRLW